MFGVLDFIFGILNYLQYFLQKPWRFALKRHNRLVGFLHHTPWRWIVLVIKFFLWCLLLPLRFFNALYYNLWVYGLWNIRDHFGDIFNPKVGGMRYKRGFNYAFFWFFGLPWRIIRYSFIGIVQFIEGLIFVLIDTVLPALTMYHGTSRGHSIDISKPGKWLVGGGDFAGSGIYFTMDKRVARHYANSRSSGRNEPVIVCARVSLGRVKNLSIAPNEIRGCIGRNGREITRWGKRWRYTTTEWWREGNNWWEYCLLHEEQGRLVRNRRIRVMYIINLNSKKRERIWGGKALWVLG